MLKAPNWFRILVAARKLDKPFTSANLARVAKLDRNDAAAWLSKFANWGYAKRMGTKRDKRRWWRLWTLTAYGNEREAPSARRASTLSAAK